MDKQLGPLTYTTLGTNLYGNGQPKDSYFGFVDVGRFTRISDVRFSGNVQIVADPTTVSDGEVFVRNCLFEGLVEHTPNVRFDSCIFECGKPRLYKDALGAAPAPAATPGERRAT
jgi:hypothetical protein